MVSKNKSLWFAFIAGYALLTVCCCCPGSAWGQDSISEVRKQLASDNAEQRLQAAKKLLNLKWDVADPVNEDVLELLADPDGRVRAYAALLTYYHKQPELGKPIVLELLNDSDPKVLSSALFVAGICWLDAPEFIEPLIELVNNADELNRWRALRCLNKRKAESITLIPLLIHVTQNDDYWAARREAYEMLVRLTPDNSEAVSALINGINDEQPDVVNYCARQLPKLGESAASTIPTLVAYIENACFGCSYHGVSEALAEFGRDPVLGSLVEEALIECLYSDDKYVIGSVCGIVEEINPTSPEIKEAVLKLLENRYHSMRNQGALLLCSVYTTDPDTVEPLIVLLSDKDKFVQYNATKALGARGGLAKSAIPLVTENLRNHFYYRVRRASAGTLGQIGYAESNVKDALLTALNDDDELVVIESLESLAMFGSLDSNAQKKLEELTASTETSVSKRAEKLLEAEQGGGR